MIPDAFPLPPFVADARTTKLSPSYQYSWAVDDCLDTSVLTADQVDKIRAMLPIQTHHQHSSQPSVPEQVSSSLTLIDEVNRVISTEYLNKLKKWINEEIFLIRNKNSPLISLIEFCESTLVHTLEREQMLDSIEEMHRTDDDRVMLIIDEIERVKSISLTDRDAANLLIQRDNTIGSPQIESQLFTYPFSVRGGAIPRLPQIGPYCHICRQRKDGMPKCSQKISFTSDIRTVCHRRFCNDCLTAYNWPKPGAGPTDPGASTIWKCPICSKLCTCDRCVRNVFIKNLKQFIVSVKGCIQPISQQTNTGTLTVNEMWSLVDNESPFSYRATAVWQESPPESPSGQPISVTVGRARRRTSKPDTLEEQHVAPTTPSVSDDTTPETKRKRQQVSLYSPL
jgi:hypothetical protein